MGRRAAVGLLLIAGSLAATPAAHAQDDPEHGGVWTSEACWDGTTPSPGDIETNRVGLTGFGATSSVGAQGGAHPEIHHDVYVDVCTEVGLPTVNVPLLGDVGGKLVGTYTSVRVMAPTDPCGAGVQFISATDDDGLLEVPTLNQCLGFHT